MRKVIARVGGSKQYLFFTAVGLLGVSADKGKELWRIPWQTEYDVNISLELFHTLSNCGSSLNISAACAAVGQ